MPKEKDSKRKGIQNEEETQTENCTEEKYEHYARKCNNKTEKDVPKEQRHDRTGKE